MKTNYKTKNAFLLFSILLSTVINSTKLWSQPYVDPIQIRYMNVYKTNKVQTSPTKNRWVGCDIPLQLKQKTYLLLSPYYEQWNIDLGNQTEPYPILQSVTFPLGLIFPIGQTKWSATTLAIVRSNGSQLFESNSFQFGAVAFASFARKEKQKFRLGMYANTEFFGLFLVPLVGLDWKINERDYLFGLLPGRITFEHKWHKKVYGGATFRTITNSYRLADGRFLRLDDNQVSVYLDYYLGKKLCLTLEPGYGLFRKIRSGTDSRDYITNVSWGNGAFLKLSTSFRIRF